MAESVAVSSSSCETAQFSAKAEVIPATNKSKGKSKGDGKDKSKSKSDLPKELDKTQGAEQASQIASESKRDAIRDLLEFYFGNANLCKDRYLGKLVQQDQSGKGWVPVNIFLRFNKVKVLTNLLEDVVSAAQTSDKLEVSPNKKRIRRTDPIPKDTHADERTIYVERLPDQISHESLRLLFGHYGNILYTSVPKFPVTRIPKGFGFVEFETAEQAESVIHDFETAGSFSTSGVRVMSKSVWLLFREKYKSLIQEAKKMGHEMLEKEEEEYIRGVLLKVSNIPKDTNRKIIRDLFQSLASVAYVDMSGDGESSIVRMHQPEGTEYVLQYHQNTPLSITGTPLDVSPISGMEEKSYWQNIRSLQDAKKETKKKKEKASKDEQKGSTQTQTQNAPNTHPKSKTRSNSKSKSKYEGIVTVREENPAEDAQPNDAAPPKRKVDHEPDTFVAKKQKSKPNTHIKFADSDDENDAMTAPLTTEKASTSLDSHTGLVNTQSTSISSDAPNHGDEDE